jgi:hypothetical protein
MSRISARRDAKRSSTYLNSETLSSSPPVLLPVAARLGRVPSPAFEWPRGQDVNG